MTVVSDPIRVLHVDDEPDLADVTATFLERHEDRLTVETATRVTEALEILDQQPIDCVVSDYQMPGQTGIEFLETVRETAPALPFILYTGKGSEEVAAEAISAGVTDYLQKESGTDQYAILANRVVNAVERDRIEREATQTRSQLEAIAEHSTDAILVIDTDSRIRFANPAVTDLFGYAPAELEGESLTTLMPDHLRQAHLDAIDRYLETDERSVNWSNVEFEARHRDGTEFPISVSFGEFGETDERRFLGIVRDVTETRARERELESEQVFIEQSIDALQDLFFVFREDGDLLRWNDRVPERTGYSTEEIADMEPADFFPPEQRERIEAAIEDIFETGGGAVEADILTADGERIPHEMSGKRLLDADGEVIGFAGTGRDISDRKARERDLLRTRDLLNQAERIADVGGWEIDPQTMDVFWTEHLFNILGVEGDTEPPLSEALDIYHEEDRSKVASAVEAALDTGEAFDVEARFHRSDGEMRWLRVFGTPTVEDGDVVRFRGAVQDVTDRKEYERRLERQNDRLEQFASVVSHDLRNPLNVAEGRLELAQIDCDSEHLEHVARAHGRMNELIEDLLTLSREGGTVGDLEPVDLTDLVETCWENVPTAEARLEVDCDQSIRADRSRLQQLLENLVGNAVEHGGSDVTVTIGLLADGFYVADDGVGIPADQSDDVFDAGFTTSEDGTGFGLSIVSQVTAAHGWEVHVTESDAGGARFEISGVAFADD